MKKITVKDVCLMKGKEKISMLTAYDAPMASLLDGEGVTALLVGDSLGMVVLGYDSTVPVTMEQMLHHAGAVSRGTKHALVVGDMPFGSYQVSVEQAVVNGVRFLKEAGCDCVKLEGGGEVCDNVRALVGAGVPVMGHIGLTPQTAGQLGGFKVQGKDMDTARKLIAGARALEEAGAFAIVLECVPGSLAEVVTRAVAIPTIGIGAGAGCDGQVLVTNDMLGLFERFTPGFVKKYLNLAPEIKTAVQSFIREVDSKEFPAEEHTFASKEDFHKLLDE
ncbi:MAG: 3-methyl-2-oxobutanoate hydroxymethyltransferase [Desulfobulbus sp.]|nr:MAG: 3-methyl-2-oxobutanoate hydroxymethyltransferase [Desulfobulbus sp.]RUM39512.1 MAG: 3-methyl-2-oxobutanoate hydroxymethyltransferase [Desulfobulbus sp.]